MWVVLLLAYRKPYLNPFRSPRLSAPLIYRIWKETTNKPYLLYNISQFVLNQISSFYHEDRVEKEIISTIVVNVKIKALLKTNVANLQSIILI